ncbi:hypothetical protein Vretimale_10038 [Volvox reticuliferus]|uniref:Uncharacterized protein n=1 Tax=Volvox reticuliferus TaxID=1737510 RepID=A0A8J4BXB1_9CHLO|nr:hypothetical protein Vretifemale_810 [Volvox reticuliferus]GIM05576.1 hypothetical protein Vretimale_10038 [Volvox reticuliferus]
MTSITSGMMRSFVNASKSLRAVDSCALGAAATRILDHHPVPSSASCCQLPASQRQLAEKEPPSSGSPALQSLELSSTCQEPPTASGPISTQPLAAPASASEDAASPFQSRYRSPFRHRETPSSCNSNSTIKCSGSRGQGFGPRHRDPLSRPSWPRAGFLVRPTIPATTTAAATAAIPFNNSRQHLGMTATLPTAPFLSGSFRELQAAAAASPPGSDSESLSLAALAAGLWDDGRDGREGLTPTAIVAALDRHIVGQAAAKRAVAVALRNRWRRMRVEPVAFRDEIMPKNILMVGPTGCGKTEVARRLAKLADAPFVKVEATKYTELGYVGRDVEEIIKDLVEAALVLVRQRAKERLAEHSARRAEAIILRALVGQHASTDTLDMFREMYRRGEMDDTNVEIDTALLDGSGSGSGGSGGSGFGGKLDFGPGGVILLDKLFSRPERPFGGASPGMGLGGGSGGGGRGGQGTKKTLKVSEARARLEEAESEKLLSSDQVSREAIRAAEQDGIVFIDEIDKIVEPSSGRVVTGGGVSSEGVQRDLLPIIEGSVVPTKHGNVSTEHVLFICSGAFHTAKPSDMLAELQGRLPIRVELKGLTAEDFHRILTEPDNNMIRQQQELLATEGVQLVFTEGAIRAVASLAEQANKLLDNIGARRLHTVLERVLADISFGAPERVAEARKEGKQTYEYVVDEELVHRKLDDLLKKQDLSRYVL